MQVEFEFDPLADISPVKDNGRITLLPTIQLVAPRLTQLRRRERYLRRCWNQNMGPLGAIVRELWPSRTVRNMKPVGDARPVVFLYRLAPISVGRFKNALGWIGN